MRNATGTPGTGISLPILYTVKHRETLVKKRKVNARATRATLITDRLYEHRTQTTH
jgi:hypothetical protein